MDLTTFFCENPKVAVAFSGGVDSAYLLYAAKQGGADVKAYYVKSPFQPEFELEDAKRFAGEFDIDLVVIPVDVLEDGQIIENPANRCYFCKKRIFSTICNRALEDGYRTILDGTNATDDVSDRPGMKALQELKVLSPLRECGLTKADVRQKSKDAGLFTWDKPSYACLATRIPTGQTITKEDLEITERSEEYLMSLGFRDFRIRRKGKTAVLEVTVDQMNKVLEYREQIMGKLCNDYDGFVLSLKAR